MIWDKMNVSNTGLFVFKKYRARHMQSHASQSSQQEALPLGLKSEGSSGDVRVWRTPALRNSSSLQQISMSSLQGSDTKRKFNSRTTSEKKKKEKKGIPAQQRKGQVEKQPTAFHKKIMPKHVRKQHRSSCYRHCFLHFPTRTSTLRCSSQLRGAESTCESLFLQMPNVLHGHVIYTANIFPSCQLTFYL